MMKKIYSLHFALGRGPLLALFSLAVCVAMSACSTPAPNSLTYTPRMSLEEMEASDNHIASVDNANRRRRAEDAMSQAQATEVATRNNPTSVSTTTVTPFFFW